MTTFSTIEAVIPAPAPAVPRGTPTTVEPPAPPAETPAHPKVQRNRALFYKVADAIEADPTCYDQANGAKCVCGLARKLDGGEPDEDGCWFFPLDGARRLGISDAESIRLFDCNWRPGLRGVPDALRRLGDGLPFDEACYAP